MPVLTFDEYKDKKTLIKKFQTAYGNEHIFRLAMLKLLGVDENMVTAFGLYFGYQKEPMTYKAIAAQMNISVPRVRVLAYKAFKRLIHPSFRQRVWEECGYKPTEVNE